MSRPLVDTAGGKANAVMLRLLGRRLNASQVASLKPVHVGTGGPGARSLLGVDARLVPQSC